MIVFYKKQMYIVDWMDAIKILRLEIKLCLCRITRNIHRIFESCKKVVMVIPLWALFIYIAYVWGVKIGKVTNVMSIIWEFKTNIFTSIILVIFLSVYDEQKTNKINLVKQSYLYYELICNLENLAKGIYQLYFDGVYKKEWIFYTNERYSEFYNCITNENIVYKNNIEITEDIESCSLLLERISTCIINNELISWNREKYKKEHNENVLRNIDRIRQCLKKINVLENSKKKQNIEILIQEMYYLIEGCRIPWRRDLNVNQEIRFLICKRNEKKLREDFYINLFLE